MNEPSIIIHPQSGDVDRALDILDEIQAALRKRGCVLIHQDNCIVLAKVNNAVGNQARAIAQIRQITPDFIEWREVDWTPKAVRSQ